MFMERTLEVKIKSVFINLDSIKLSKKNAALLSECEFENLNTL